MKSLKEALLNEALLNRPKKVDVVEIVAAAAEAYINDNYIVSGKLTFENVNGVWIANCDIGVVVKNAEIEKLTEGFEWGGLDKS